MSLILPFDTETTGLPIWKEPSESKQQPHAVQIAAQLVDEDTKEVKGELDVIIKPDGWEWDEDNEAFQVHGITVEQAMDVGVPEDQAISMYMELHALCSKRVAFNTTFDNRIIRIGLHRYFGEEQADKYKTLPYYCTMINSKKVIGGKNQKLIEVYRYLFGKEMEDAHNAMGDTIACREIYFALMELKKKDYL